MVKRILSVPFPKLISFILNPLFLIWQIPIAWAKSLWAARILANGQLSRYIGFHPNNSLNSFFYKTQAINLNKFGRSGISNLIGLGDFSLKSWFHISVISNYIYTSGGAVTTLFAVLVWIFSHFAWIGDRDFIQVFLVIIILFSSSTAYAMAFARQNYQMLGWMWFPLGLFFLLKQQWILASFCWFAAGLSGITPVFFSVVFVMLFSLKDQTLKPLLTVIPVGLSWGFYLLPSITDRGFYSSANNIFKLIGLNGKEVRYKRMKSIGLDTIYFGGLYLTGCLLFYWLCNSVPLLSAACLLLFLINQIFVRVADEQSLIVLFVSIFTFEVIQQDFNWVLLGVLWLVLNAHANFLLIGRVSKAGIFDVSVHPPFDHTTIVDKLKIFMAKVKPGEKIYFAFNNPEGNYSNVFDGYRVIIEPPLTVASELGIHLFPDWYAVAETNYIGAPECWGRQPGEVMDNLKRWGANYAIIYQTAQTSLDSCWSANFEEVSSFDWHDNMYLFRGEPLWSGDLPIPKWFLIKVKNKVFQQ